MNGKIRGETEFIYHNVGQGLFYSGEIKLYNASNVFRFIYDCGSKNVRLLNSSIRRLKQDFGYDEIDLVIISHLHSDHINGLNELFNNFAIKDVILPYFTPIERLLIALRRINLPLWYYEFLSDPVKYLMKNGVKRVIIIGGEIEGKESAPPEDVSPFPPEKEEKLDIDKLQDFEELREEVERYDYNWVEYIRDGRLLIKNHNGYITALGLWLFRFFNYRVTSSNLQQFSSCFNQVVDNRDIKNAITNKKSLKDLKLCYSKLSKKLKSDFNNTSLVLYHGPIGSSYINYCECECRHLACCPFHMTRDFFGIGKHNKFGQFLTGDIDLNTRYDDLIKHYTHCLRNVIITQVPHHGSIKNWNERIMIDAPNTVLWIIPAGIINRYGHPSYRLIENLFINRKNCIWVNEINFLIIRGKVTW